MKRHYAGILLAIAALMAGSVLTGCGDNSPINIDSDDIDNSRVYQTMDRTWMPRPTNTVEEVTP